MTSSLLILTVGTGTAGRESNVAEGLANTVRMIQPCGYWLVPSASEKSLPVADLVRDSVGDAAAFIPWDSETDYRAILNPDALEDCRGAVREVIRRARKKLRPGERLLVNPTSGTKQMSAGAVLAALDEGVGEIIFTVGDRADGVVRTGTERLESFDALRFYAERDHALACELAASGAPEAAHRILSHHESLRDDADVALCLHEWERLNYEAARQVAAKSKAPALREVRHFLNELASAASAGKPHILIVSDLLENAAIFHRRGDSESSLFQTCKALEMGLRVRLLETTGLCDPYSLASLRRLPLGKDLMFRLEKNSSNAQTCILGIRQVVEVLKALGDPLADDFRSDRRLGDLLAIRNELTHAIRSVSEKQSADFLSHTKRLLEQGRDWPQVPSRPMLRPCQKT